MNKLYKYLKFFFLYKYNMKYDSITDIIILGEQYVGKTLFINNYLYNSTKTNHLTPTIGVDFYKKSINYNNNNYLFKLWDTGNGLLYKNILEFYLRNSSIFIIISTEKNINFIKKVFDIIDNDKKINPKYIFIIYNKKNNNDLFQYNTKEILAYNTNIKNIYFSYINIMNNIEVNDIFNKIKFIIFSDFENNNEKVVKNLIPLNKNNNQIKKSSCDYCCTIC